eukprot:scaffold199082_cov22-Tisochrysis_lutea.AAC.1
MLDEPMAFRNPYTFIAFRSTWARQLRLMDAAARVRRRFSSSRSATRFDDLRSQNPRHTACILVASPARNAAMSSSCSACFCRHAGRNSRMRRCNTLAESTYETGQGRVEHRAACAHTWQRRTKRAGPTEASRLRCPAAPTSCCRFSRCR